jgi:hypothetical protein
VIENTKERRVGGDANKFRIVEAYDIPSCEIVNERTKERGVRGHNGRRGASLGHHYIAYSYIFRKRAAAENLQGGGEGGGKGATTWREFTRLRVKYADLRPRSYFLSSLLLSAETSAPSRITSVGLWSSESEVLGARPNPSLAMVVRSMISNFLSTSPHPSCVIMKRLPLPASKLKHGQERGPVSADQRQRWRHFSTTPVDHRGAFPVPTPSCCRDFPVIHSVHYK